MGTAWKEQEIRKCSEFRWIVVVTIFTSLVLCCESFNVDTVNFIKHSGPAGSMFGFSVAEHKERGKNWVLVGAPEAQTRQPGVSRGGSVYRCEVTKDETCEEIPFDSTGNNNNTDGRQIDKKSEQWFGATVRSSGETGVVLACAPRYVWFSTTTAYRRDPVGTCYIAKNDFSEFSEYSPCRTRNWGYHRQGSCQAGLGADVSKDGNRLYVGAPGSWYWQGQIYDITSTFKMPTISPDYSKNHELNLIEYESGNKEGRKKTGNLSNKNNQHNQSNQQGRGQLYAQNPHKRPEVMATSEGSPQDDDSYLGYSVAAGDFEGRGEGGVAVGMPRGAGLFGKVVLYSVNLTNLQNLTGHQLGSYFSYSLAAQDVDGDGLDDVIVGAPLYTDLNNNEGKYETGRVYIYYQEPKIDSDGYYTRFAKYDFRDGKNSKARFGLSVAGLGDMNKDGYGDFAVGAPYDGPEGRGAVYIYQGMKGGVRESYSQVIKAEELSVPTSTFGFSLAGGYDMDENQYPDLVVGAYESDTAIFFRSRPVVRMADARLSFNSKTKQISLEDENCTLRDYTKVPCLYLQACLKYSGAEVDRQLDMDIGVTLDTKKPKSPRMFFLNEEGKYIKNDTIRLTKGELNCKSYYVYIKPNIRDKLTALEAELRYGVKDSSGSQIGLGRRYTRSLTPILDASDMNIQKDSLSIQKNCGPDNICIPDLRVATKKSVSKYLLGSGDRFTLDVQVENKGEDAFEAMYNLQVPPGMNYINIERLDSDRSIPVTCSAPSALTNHTLKCDIGNPLPKEKLVHFKVHMQPFHREGMKSSYNFISTVNSTNPEDEFTARDNVEAFTVPIWVETDLILQGSSYPADVHYNVSHYEGDSIRDEMDIGPQVVHVYNIRNKGPSDILEAQAIFLWPSYTMSGEHLLYLLEQPETSGNVKCEYVENVNEEHIELDRKRKSYLESGAFSAAHFTGRGSGSGRGRGGGAGWGRGISAGGASGQRGETAWRGLDGQAGRWDIIWNNLSAGERRQIEEELKRRGAWRAELGQGGRLENLSWDNLSAEERRLIEEEFRKGSAWRGAGAQGGKWESLAWSNLNAADRRQMEEEFKRRGVWRGESGRWANISWDNLSAEDRRLIGEELRRRGGSAWRGAGGQGGKWESLAWSNLNAADRRQIEEELRRRGVWRGEGGGWENLSWDNLSAEDRRLIGEELRRRGGAAWRGVGGQGGKWESLAWSNLNAADRRQIEEELRRRGVWRGESGGLENLSWNNLSAEDRRLIGEELRRRGGAAWRGAGGQGGKWESLAWSNLNAADRRQMEEELRRRGVWRGESGGWENINWDNLSAEDRRLIGEELRRRGGAAWRGAGGQSGKWESFSWDNLPAEDKRRVEEELRRKGEALGRNWDNLSWETMTEEERRQITDELRTAGIDFDSRDGTLLTRTSTHGTTGGRRIISSGGGYSSGGSSASRGSYSFSGGGGIRVTSGGSGTRTGGASTGSGTEEVRYTTGSGGSGVRVVSGAGESGVRVVSGGEGGGVRVVSGGEGGGVRVVSGGEGAGVRVVSGAGGSGVRVVSGGEGGGVKVVSGAGGSGVKVVSGSEGSVGSSEGRGVEAGSTGGRIEGAVSGGEISWSEERSSSSSFGSTSGASGRSRAGGEQGSFGQGTYRAEGGSLAGRRFEWDGAQGGKVDGEFSSGGKVRTQDERKVIQQKPLVFNATGYSRARGKVDADMAKNVSDSSTILKKAFGQNEFRTVSLDLTPGQGSGVGINVIGGEDVNINEITGDGLESHESGTFVTAGGASKPMGRTREYEEAINRELERKRLEIEEAAAAAAAAAAGLGSDKRTTEAPGTTEGGVRIFQVHGGSGSYEGSKTYEGSATGGRGETVSSESSGGTSTFVTHGGGSRTFTTSRNGTRTYEIHGGHRGYEGHGGSATTYEQEEAIRRENERRRLEAEAAAAAARASGSQSGGSRTYQIHGSILGNGTRTYKILSNGTKVYETRYEDSEGFGEGTRSYEYEDALNREYERRRQESEAAAAAARGIQTHGGGYRTYETQGSRAYGAPGFDLRAQEEALRRDYEVKRQEAENIAKELERIRVESEAGGASYSARMHDTIESLRREYEKKRLEVEAAAAAAAAAATARSSGGSSHQYSTEYHYRTNSTWGSDRPRTDSSGRWYVNNNGTVHSGSVGYDSEYLRQLQEEHERRLREEAARRAEGAGIQYHNSSYFNSAERRDYASREKNIDPDLGYVRTRSVDEPEGKSETRYFRTRQRYQSENLVDDDLETKYQKSLERNKRHPMLLTRYKRQLNPKDLDLKASLSCGPTNCTKIKCTVGPLTRGQEATVAFRGRVWVDTLKKIGYQREVMLSSLLASQVTKLPHIGEPHNAKVETYEVFSEIMPQDVPVKPEVAPLWIIVLSACAGTLILLLLIFLLWKLGFFKRNRPSNAPEKQPLNRNGYNAGDEQL